MLRYQKPDIFSKNNNKVKVRFYPGAIAEDITDHLWERNYEKETRCDSHTYSDNDLKNDVNTRKYVRSFTKIIEKMNGGGNIQEGFSGLLRGEITILVRKLRH